MENELTNSEWRSSALYQYAVIHGRDYPQVEYILSPYDTWLRNPNYTGPRGRHPEDYPED